MAVPKSQSDSRRGELLKVPRASRLKLSSFISSHRLPKQIGREVSVLMQHFKQQNKADTLKNVFTLKGKVHDARVQCIHLCVRITMHTVEIIRRLVGLLGEWTVRKVRNRVEGRGLGRGRGHGG